MFKGLTLITLGSSLGMLVLDESESVVDAPGSDSSTITASVPLRMPSLLV